MAVAAAALFLTAAGRASATTIGLFSYDVDPDLGPVFTIENLTTGLDVGTFDNIVVHLFEASAPVLDVSVDPVSAGSLSQTLADLTDPAYAFDSASLSLDFSVPGSVLTSPLVSLSFSGDAGSFVGASASSPITFDPAASAVPEPATLVLMLMGGGMILARRRRHPQRG